MPEFISISEAVELTGKSQSTITRLLRRHQGSEHVRKEGKAYVVNKDWLLTQPDYSLTNHVTSHDYKQQSPRIEPETAKEEVKPQPVTSHDYSHKREVELLEAMLEIMEEQVKKKDQEVKAKEEQIKGERERNDRQAQAHERQILQFLERIKEANYTIASMKQLQAPEEPELSPTPKRDPLQYYLLGGVLFIIVLAVIGIFLYIKS